MLKNLAFLFAMFFALPCMAAAEPIIESKNSEVIRVSPTQTQVDEEYVDERPTLMEEQKARLLDSQPTGFNGMNELEVEDYDRALAREQNKPNLLTGDTSINIQKIAQELNVRRGATFDAILIEEEDRTWSFQGDDKHVARMLKKGQDGDMVVYNFEAVEDGFSRLYFDYIERKGGDVTVLESRILDLTVGVPSAQAD